MTWVRAINSNLVEVRVAMSCSRSSASSLVIANVLEKSKRREQAESASAVL
jgi:hypothetical protein